jgi:RimJ/RimL family protein N-acetyltransferase
MTDLRTSELETKRLILRPFKACDAPAVQTLCGDPVVARMTSRIPNPLPAGHVARWIDGHGALREADREWPFCITLNGRPIGAIALRRTDDGGLRLGYWLGADYWNQGYATEAARAVSAYGLETLRANTVRAGAYVDNSASANVLEKCGFRYTHTDSQWSEARGDVVPCRRYTLETHARRAR